MNRLFTLYLSAATLMLLTSWPSLAQEGLSLRECIDIAMRNQVDVQVGGNTLEAADARLARTISGNFPRVTAEYGGDLARSESRRDGGLSVSVSQDFYDGGLRGLRIRGAKEEVAQSGYSLSRVRQGVAFSVTRDYFSLLRTQRLAGVQQARVSYLEGQLELVRTRIRLGDAAEVDALPVEAQLANARVDRLSAENDIRVSAIQLQNTMGLTPEPEFAVRDVSEPSGYQIPAADECVLIALAERPEVGQSEASIRLAKAGVDSAKLSLRPRPVISGQYAKSIIGGIGNSFSANDGIWAITGSIVYDLFDGGNNRAAYREELAGLSSTEVRAGQVKKDIQSEVRQAHLNLTNARERMAASDLSLSASRRNLEVQESRYKQGLAIPLDLLNAQVEVVTAESNSVRARYDYYTALAQLEYAMGRAGGIDEN